ncbi:MAG: NAD-dependent epimerase/dehydratase family protein [Nannocystaceae bacterium]
MRIIILGGDGYLGWPTAMHFAARGHEVTVVDNYMRRQIARETRSEPLIETSNLNDRAELFEACSGKHIEVVIGDCNDYRMMSKLFGDVVPEAVVHYAEQPSAPYSMIDYDCARRTLDNNLGATFNVIWAVHEHAPDCHIIKLGTMGEYGTPNIDIEEGWIEIEHKGRKDTFLYPRAAGSLYHTTKVLDTDLLWFYVRTYGLRVTDLMQGPVYGLATDETELDPRLAPNFHYDDIFGTAVNRFLVQAVAGVPLTVYGKGGQTRGYLNLKDTLQCVDLAVCEPVARGKLRILNQFTEQYSVNQLAECVQVAGELRGLSVEISPIENPRKEKEDHYYNAAHSGLLELGLKPHPMTAQVLAEMLDRVIEHKSDIDPRRILPRVRWNDKNSAPT